MLSSNALPSAIAVSVGPGGRSWHEHQGGEALTELQGSCFQIARCSEPCTPAKRARGSMQAFVNFLTRIYDRLVRLGHSTGSKNLETDPDRHVVAVPKLASLPAPEVIAESQAQISPGVEDQSRGLDLQPARELQSQPSPPAQLKLAKPASGNMSQKTSSASHPWHDLSAGEVSSARKQIPGAFSAATA